MNNISSEKAKLIEKHVNRLKKIYQQPICLAQGDCGGVIGRSHTISEAMSLKYIAENDHVLVRQVNAQMHKWCQALKIDITPFLLLSSPHGKTSYNRIP